MATTAKELSEKAQSIAEGICHMWTCGIEDPCEDFVIVSDQVMNQGTARSENPEKSITFLHIRSMHHKQWSKVHLARVHQKNGCWGSKSQIPIDGITEF